MSLPHFLIAFLTLTFCAVVTSAQENSVDIASAIEVYPQPNVRPLPLDERILYDRVYRKVVGPLTVFDAPGGSVVRDFGSGFAYVTLSGSMSLGDWTQIGPAEWVPSNILNEDVMISRFAGVLLPDDVLPYPMAWTLRHLRASKEPGGEQSPDNPFMYRYTRVSLYSYTEFDGYRWYQIGKDQWVHQFNVAKILPIERPVEIQTDKWVSVDLYEQVLIAYEGDTPVFSTLVSSGLSSWPTNEGLFNVYLRYGRTLMAGAFGRPDFYYLEEVPYTLYFDGDIGLHGTYWHDGFGYRQSHGCVNLSITDAKWLFDWSADVRASNPDGLDLSVLVYSSNEYR